MISLSLSLLSIFLGSKSAKDRLGDKIYDFRSLYPCDALCQRSITI